MVLVSVTLFVIPAICIATCYTVIVRYTLLTFLFKNSGKSSGYFKPLASDNSLNRTVPQKVCEIMIWNVSFGLN
jgi:hypothetical protein